MSSEKKIPEVSLPKFIRHSLSILRNPLPFHKANFNKYGNSFRLNVGFGKSVIFTRDAELLSYVLQKNQKNYLKSPIQTRDLAKYIGKGLLTAEGEKWQKQRRLVQPAFHKSQLVQLLETIQSTINNELDLIPTNRPFDIFPVFNDLAFQTVVKSLFSSEIEDTDIKQLQHTTEITQKMLVKELRQPYLGWWFKLSGKIKFHIDLIDQSRAILHKLVTQRKQSAIRYNDLLDMLLDAKYEDGSSMEETQLLDEILILFAAGHETTSNALTFTCELLARHPQAQSKILEEIHKNKNESFDLMDKINHATYTKWVIQEAMRLYPPAYFIDRVNKELDSFQELELPKGSNLLFSVYEIHRHPEFWSNPEAFIPERFSDETVKFSKNYYPFGAGQRMCIGNNFAMYEMILAILSVVENYEIVEKKSPIQIKPLITLKPFESILEFKKRT
ncbi:cytochrome P450 [Flavobacterium sp. TP390]|uniref:Cytochrome P450 n=1 Tax=Flavobacterium profundi TaxID=1774945 RepID=A0A6I4IGM0_9FLAO|nr:cytochrome P450 [Flavobacterium profundi]MVO08845.1 cytochrome P450 [Flavobacterium profundi]